MITTLKLLLFLFNVLLYIFLFRFSISFAIALFSNSDLEKFENFFEELYKEENDFDFHELFLLSNNKIAKRYLFNEEPKLE